MVAVVALRPGTKPPPPPKATAPAPVRTTLPPPKPVAPPPVKAALVSWQLPVPVTQTVVLPGPGTTLVVIGGLVSSGGSGTGAFLLDTSSGSLHLTADLEAGVHEASGAMLGSKDFVFGGMGAAATASVQSFPAPGVTATPPAGPGTSASSAHSTAAPSTTPSTTAAPSTTVAGPPAQATAASSLPRPRAGSGTVKVGGSIYLVGGYDGPAADGAVLATSDGQTFHTAGHLPVPVRDPAVAAVGGQIYVFGGAVRASAPRWVPVADIQQMDPRTGRARVVGRLPVAVQGAAAVTLDGHVYVAGGSGPAGTSSAIWGLALPLHPGTAAFTAAVTAAPVLDVVLAGRLPVPVYGAGVTAKGARAWLVGGQSRGHLIGSVQEFTLQGPAAGRVPPPATGLSRSSATTSTSLPPRG